MKKKKWIKVTCGVALDSYKSGKYESKQIYSKKYPLITIFNIKLCSVAHFPTWGEWYIREL
jgi:hypothetical protein